MDDAGYDLCSVESIDILPGQTQIVNTGLVVAVPQYHVGMVCSRSGLAAKHQISVLNAPGIIDAGYRGELKVILHNAGNEKYEVALGDKIAQLLICPIAVKRDSQLTEVNYLTSDDTERSEAGLGSTGR